MPPPEHSREHPPVLLLHGTSDTPARLEPLAAALRATGRTVVAPNYGHERRSLRGRLVANGATADLATSSAEIAAAVEELLAATGAAQVDLVGHSQGGLQAHAYARGLGLPSPGAARVRRIVTLAGSLHGASPLGPFDGLFHTRAVAALLDGLLGPAARQQVRGSQVLAWLDAHAEHEQAVTTTAFVTRLDRTVRPPRGRLLDPRPGYSHVWVHDIDPASRTPHATLPQDPHVIAAVVAALEAP